VNQGEKLANFVASLSKNQKIEMKKSLLASSVFVFGLFCTSVAQDLTELYEKVNPAVVTLQVESEEVAAISGGKQKTIVAGLGSGFMISEKRLITAAHVVQTATSIKVHIGKDQIPAKVISVYKNADVALVELAFAPRFPAKVVFGDSDAVKVGERVFIIGAPLGLQHSLSSGYISRRMGLERDVTSAFTRVELFQTDAAINQGNSGGPMFNMKGEVIGIVSYILSQSGGFEGLGFATTSNVAKELLIDRNPFYLGIDGVPVSGELAKIFNLPQAEAYLVEKVVFLSPGGMMGLKGGVYDAQIEDLKLKLGGDFILAIDGIKFSEANLVAIGEKFNSYKLGDSFTITVLRDGKVQVLSGTLNH